LKAVTEQDSFDDRSDARQSHRTEESLISSVSKNLTQEIQRPTRKIQNDLAPIETSPSTTIPSSSLTHSEAGDHSEKRSNPFNKIFEGEGSYMKSRQKVE